MSHMRSKCCRPYERHSRKEMEMNVHRQKEKTFFRLRAVCSFCLLCMILTLCGCSAVLSAEGIHSLRDKMADRQVEGGESLSREDLLENGEEKETEEVPLSQELQILLRTGRRVLDKEGYGAAYVKKFSGVESYESARDDILLALNTETAVIEYLPANERDIEGYFKNYADPGKFLGKSYRDFEAGSARQLHLHSLMYRESGETGKAVQNEQDEDRKAGGSELPDPDCFYEKETLLAWKRYTYFFKDNMYAEYFGGVPYDNAHTSGILSVHMKLCLKDSEKSQTGDLNTVEQEERKALTEPDPLQSGDDLFMRAAGAVVPIQR